MKTIILPTDFSDNAWKAMCYAADIYHQTPCKFYIVNTYSLPVNYGESGIIMPVEPLHEESEKQLKRLLDEFKELDHHQSSEFVTKSILGALTDSIKDIDEKSDDSTVIIMGTKGASGMGELFFGTMTTNIIKNSKSPVICVPNQADLKTPRNILFAIDDQLISSKKVVEPFLDIAKEWQSNIMTVHINSDEEDNIEKKSVQIASDYYLEDVEHTFQSIKGEFIEDELNRFARHNETDLIVMTKRDKGFWKNLFQTSHTKNMVFYSKIPIMVLKD